MLSTKLISINDGDSSRKFANFSENTLSFVVSNSVGMAILALRARYFGESPNEIVLSQNYQNSISQLNSRSNQEFKPEIDYIIKRMMEEPNELDSVTLFQPNNLIIADNSNYKKHIFLLKEVFTLVWMALHDNTQFLQNYSGAIEEKTNAAALDLPQRIKTFFQTLSELKAENNCHHGIRNELVFTLNKIHSDVDIIEDPRSTVLCFLKDHIKTAIFDKFDLTLISTHNNASLLPALIKWMSHGNAVDILQLADPNGITRQSLFQLFITNGINPDGLSLNLMIDEALSSLEFSCDPKIHIILDMMSILLQSYPREGDDERNFALLKMQNWLSTAWQPTPENKKILSEFMLYYNAHEFLRNYFYLSALPADKQQQVESLAEKCIAYFTAYRLSKPTRAISSNTLQTCKWLESFNQQCKSELMFDIVENFFMEWIRAYTLYEKTKDQYLQKPYLEKLKKLYAILQDKMFQSKVILTDDTINKFMESIPREFFDLYRWDIKPYMISRVFLHAIIIPLEQWTPIYGRAFRCVLNFTEKSNESLWIKAFQDCTFKRLREQFNYYSDQSMGGHYVIRQRPSNMILMPDQVKTIGDWYRVIRFLNEDDRYLAYQAQALKIETLYKNTEAVKAIIQTHDINEILTGLPVEKWVGLITRMEIKNIKGIKESYFWALLWSIDIENRFLFLMREEIQETVRSLMNEPICLGKFVFSLPNGTLHALANAVKASPVSSTITNYCHLVEVWPKKSELILINEIGIEIFKSIIKNSSNFNRLFKRMPENDFVILINQLGISYLKSIFKPAHDNFKILQKMLPAAIQQKVKSYPNVSLSVRLFKPYDAFFSSLETVLKAEDKKQTPEINKTKSKWWQYALLSTLIILGIAAIFTGIGSLVGLGIIAFSMSTITNGFLIGGGGTLILGACGFIKRLRNRNDKSSVNPITASDIPLEDKQINIENTNNHISQSLRLDESSAPTPTIHRPRASSLSSISRNSIFKSNLSESKSTEPSVTTSKMTGFHNRSGNRRNSI